MGTRPRKYIWVNRSYFNTGLKPLDILILSMIEEHDTHDRSFELTNEELADMFGETVYAVKRSLSRLEERGMIERESSYVSGNGKRTRRREIRVRG